MGTWEHCPEGEGATHMSYVPGKSIRATDQLLSWVLAVKRDEGYLGSELSFETHALGGH